LLYEKLKVIPHPGDRGGEVGDTAKFFSVLPEVTTTVSASNQRIASKEAKIWIDDHQDDLAEAWKKAKKNRPLWEWAAPQRELRWVEQAQTYGGVFDESSIPYIARLLPESEDRIRKIYEMSTDPRHVKRWLKQWDDEADIAYSAWVLGWLIRGKYYENLAKQVGWHLVPHPLRKGLEEPLERGTSRKVYLSEELFIKILIGSAQSETSAERRVAVLGENIDRALKAIKAKAISLPESTTEDQAENFAVQAARTAGIQVVPKIYRQMIDRFVDVGAHAFLAYSLSYWIPHEAIPAINAATQLGYYELRGVSPGHDLSDIALSTKKRFKWLSTLPAGRLDSEIILPGETPTDKP
jgi:hypothetical protein